MIKLFSFFHRKKLYLLPALMALAWFICALPNHELAIFPGISPNFVQAFNDQESGGNSIVDNFAVSKKGITIRYTLRNRLSYPYSGCKLVLLGDDSLPRNMSSYDYLFLDITCKKQQSIDFYLHVDLAGRTIPSQPLTYRFLYKYLVFLDPRESKKVDLFSLETPGWWYYNHHLPDNSLGKESFRRVSEIVVQSGNNNPIDQEFEFTINQISVHRDLKKRGISAIIFISGWFLLYTLFYLGYIRQNPAGKKVVVQYEPLVVNNQSDETLERIIQYIAREYANPDLTVHTVAREVGVMPSRITQILLEKRECSYKQYLNAIRLEEAKRLLSETDRTITEIAYKVGYRNVTHFNRTFKEAFGQSPGSFRART